MVERQRRTRGAAASGTPTDVVGEQGVVPIKKGAEALEITDPLMGEAKSLFRDAFGVVSHWPEYRQAIADIYLQEGSASSHEPIIFDRNGERHAISMMPLDERDSAYIQIFIKGDTTEPKEKTRRDIILERDFSAFDTFFGASYYGPNSHWHIPSGVSYMDRETYKEEPWLRGKMIKRPVHDVEALPGANRLVARLMLLEGSKPTPVGANITPAK